MKPKSKIPFRNNKGNKIQFGGKLTLEDLFRMGVKDIKLIPGGTSIPDGWWLECGK